MKTDMQKRRTSFGISHFFPACYVCHWAFKAAKETSTHYCAFTFIRWTCTFSCLLQMSSLWDCTLSVVLSIAKQEKMMLLKHSCSHLKLIARWYQELEWEWCKQGYAWHFHIQHTHAHTNRQSHNELVNSHLSKMTTKTCSVFLDSDCGCWKESLKQLPYTPKG